MVFIAGFCDVMALKGKVELHKEAFKSESQSHTRQKREQ